MYLPKFTIARLLLITAVCGCFFAVLAMAVRGKVWAIGISMGVGVTLLALLFQMLVYVVALLVSEVNTEQSQPPETPFASNEPSPQVVPPPQDQAY